MREPILLDHEDGERCLWTDDYEFFDCVSDYLTEEADLDFDIRFTKHDARWGILFPSSITTEFVERTVNLLLGRHRDYFKIGPVSLRTSDS